MSNNNQKKKEEFVKLFVDFYEMFFSSTAQAVKAFAEMEQKFPEEYKMIKEFGEDPQAIEDLIDTLPSDRQTIILKILLKSGKFSRDFANLFNLSIEEKKKLSDDLLKFSKELKEAIKK